MRKINSLWFQSGFTLVEVAVAMGMVGLVSLGVMKINQQMNRAGKNMEQQLDITQIVGRLSTNLLDTTACVKTFKDKTLTVGTAITEIRNDNNDVILSVNDKIGKVTLTGMIFSRVDAPGPVSIIEDPDVPGTYISVTRRAAQLRLTFKKGTSGNDAADHATTLGALEKKENYELSFYVLSPANTNIETCHSQVSQYVEESCNIFEGQFQGGKCRSTHTYDNSIPATPNAATFHGDVDITNTGASGGGTGALTVAGVTTLNSTLRVLNDLTTLRSLIVNGGGTPLNGTLGVTGAVTLGNTLSVTDSTTLSSTLSVSGAATFSNNLSVSGNVIANGNVTVGGNTFLGNQATDQTSVRGRLCLQGTTSCITSWNKPVVRNTCSTVSNIGNEFNLSCPANTFAVSMARYIFANNVWTLTCCSLRGWSQ